MITHTKHNIVISPIGDIDDKLVEPITSEIERIFGFKTVVKPILHDVNFALDTARNQYHSTLILEKLELSAPSEAIKLLAITDVDLYIPILTYVYGEAQLGGKASIISTHRLVEGISPVNTPETFHCRLAKEAVHELGHTFKLRHCPDHSCIMHYSRTVTDVDRKTDQLCRYCDVLLEDDKKRLAEINPPA